MALKGLIGVDPRGAGRLLSDIADYGLARDQLGMQQAQIDSTTEATAAALELQKQKVGIDVQKLGIEHFGAPIYELGPEGKVQIVSDLMIGAVNPATGHPMFDKSKATPEQSAFISEGEARVNATYASMKPGTYDPYEQQKAYNTVYRGAGLTQEQVVNPKYKGVIVEDGRPVTLEELRQRDVGQQQLNLEELRGVNAFISIAESKDWDYKIMERSLQLTGTEDRKTIIARADKLLETELAKMEVGQTYDLEKMSKQTGFNLELLEAEWDFKKDAQMAGLDWEKERLQLVQDFDYLMQQTGHSFAKELQDDKFTHIEMLHDKSFENEKVMASIENVYTKELQQLGFANAKDLKNMGFEHAWDVTTYLEGAKRSNLEYATIAENESKIMMYNLFRRDAIEDRGYAEKWYKELENYKVAMKSEAAAKMTVAGMPNLVYPLAMKTGEWESSWMGFNESDWIEGLNTEFLDPAKAGGGQALVDMAEIEPDNPLVQMYLDNIDHVLTTMGAPKTPGGNWTDSELGANVWVFGHPKFHNWGDATKKEALQAWETLLLLRGQIKDAQSKASTP